jgi:hypothetical protein
MRIQDLAVIVASSLCLCACAQIIDSTASTDTETSQQAGAQDQGVGCAKVNELQVGMTTAQILSICERRPQRTSDMITRDAKKLTVWIYGTTSIQLADDKIVRIFSP